MERSRVQTAPLLKRWSWLFFFSEKEIGFMSGSLKSQILWCCQVLQLKWSKHMGMQTCEKPVFLVVLLSYHLKTSRWITVSIMSLKTTVKARIKYMMWTKLTCYLKTPADYRYVHICIINPIVLYFGPSSLQAWFLKWDSICHGSIQALLAEWSMVCCTKM